MLIISLLLACTSPDAPAHAAPAAPEVTVIAPLVPPAVVDSAPAGQVLAPPAEGPQVTPTVAPEAPPEPIAVDDAEDAVADVTPPEATESEPEPVAPPERGPQTYTLLPSNSFLAVSVFNDPESLGAAMGHDHVLVGSTFTGSVTWSPDDPDACVVDIRLPVSALVVDPQGARSRVGLDPDDAVSAKNNEKILDNALGKKQLEASKFSTIRYHADDCTERADGRYDVTGTLTIHGVGKRFTLPMRIDDESGLHATGTFRARASDFGFDPFKNLGGALRNLDRMSFTVDLVGS